jgi:hypothetical protein
VPFRPIQVTSDLPDIGVHRETYNLDFKSTVEKTQPSELAKDVAAFANADGGTILVGANEDKQTNTLQGWCPLTKKDADSAVAKFYDATLNGCDPRPVIDPQIILRAEKDYVVAVNVFPYPVGPVGVKRTADASEGKQWETWAFWVRVGIHNLLFTPPQAAMLMIPNLRRITAMLDSIPTDKRASLHIHFRRPQMPATDLKHQIYDAEFRGVRLRENVAAFTVWGGSLARSEVHIPLEQIESVWTLSTGDWCIFAMGQFRTHAGNLVYVFND